MTTTTNAPGTASVPATRTSPLALRIGLAALAAAAADTVIGFVASAFDKGGIGIGLEPVAYLPLTVVGLLLGAVGWTVIARRFPRALRLVVPSALVLTWIPDLLLMTMGATAANVIGLMCMHVVVTVSVVAAMRVRAS